MKLLRYKTRFELPELLRKKYTVTVPKSKYQAKWQKILLSRSAPEAAGTAAICNYCKRHLKRKSMPNHAIANPRVLCVNPRWELQLARLEQKSESNVRVNSLLALISYACAFSFDWFGCLSLCFRFVWSVLVLNWHLHFYCDFIWLIFVVLAFSLIV